MLPQLLHRSKGFEAALFFSKNFKCVIFQLSNALGLMRFGCKFAEMRKIKIWWKSRNFPFWYADLRSPWSPWGHIIGYEKSRIFNFFFQISKLDISASFCPNDFGVGAFESSWWVLFKKIQKNSSFLIPLRFWVRLRTSGCFEEKSSSLKHPSFLKCFIKWY